MATLKGRKAWRASAVIVEGTVILADESDGTATVKNKHDDVNWALFARDLAVTPSEALAQIDAAIAKLNSFRASVVSEMRLREVLG